MFSNPLQNSLELLWKRSISDKETKYQINLLITFFQTTTTSKYRSWTMISKYCRRTLRSIKNTNKYKTTTSCTFHRRQTRRAKMERLRLYIQEINNLITKFKQNQHFKGRTLQELSVTKWFLEPVKLNKILIRRIQLPHHDHVGEKRIRHYPCLLNLVAEVVVVVVMLMF